MDRGDPLDAHARGAVGGGVISKRKDNGGGMTIEQLVAKQQIDIENLKEEKQALSEVLELIELMMVCVGGPLNDNKYSYNREQLQIFFKFKSIIGGHEGPLYDFYAKRGE